MRGTESGRGARLSLIVAGVIAGAVLGPIAADGAQKLGAVVIGNKPSNPIPTRIEGTTRVTGQVTVSADAKKPLPVAPQGPVTVGGTLNVGNDQAHAVPVSAGVPYRVQYSFTIPAGQQLGQVGVDIPAGKTLIVKQFTADALSYGKNILVKVDTNSGSTTYVMQPSMVNGEVVASEQTNITASGTIGVRAYVDSSSLPAQDLGVSGVLDGVLVPSS